MFSQVAEIGEEDFGGAAAVVVADAVREAGGFAVEQDEVGVETGRVDENDPGVVFCCLLCLGIDDSYPFGFVRFFIVEDLGDDAIGLQGEVTGAFGPGDRGG